jgi:superfamily II DNA or RNA helicase
MARKDIEELTELLGQFGTVIIDEAHICPMPFIRSVLMRSPSLYRIGGTATLDNYKAGTKLVKWTLGEVAFTSEDINAVKGNQMPITHCHVEFTKFEYEAEDDDIFDMNALNYNLVNDVDRNYLILQKALADVDAGHRVLITSSRVAHCKLLEEMCKVRGYFPVVLTGTKEDGVGGFKEDVSEIKSGLACLVLATDQLIREGANLEPLDRLHVAFPIASRLNFKQLVGRIGRRSDATGKTDAEVTLYFDHKVPTLRKRVTQKMLPVLRELDVPNLQNYWIV